MTSGTQPIPPRGQPLLASRGATGRTRTVAHSVNVLTVSVFSLKGGVGKTTVTLGLAGSAQARGLRTLVADLDPQANATSALDPAQITLTANDVLAGSRAGSVAKAVTTSGWGDGLSVLPSEPALALRNYPVDGSAGAHRLRAAMNGLTGYDLMLIDCPPSLGELTTNALAASDLAVVVTEPTMFALTGAQQALTTLDTVRRGFNLRLHPAGIVVNRARPRSVEHRFRIEELIAAYHDLVLDPVLPERSAVPRAQGSCRPIQSWQSSGAREVAEIFSGYLTHLLTLARVGGPLMKGGRR